MIKEHVSVFRRLMIFTDACIVGLSFYLGYLLRDKLHNLYPLSAYIKLLPTLLLIWLSLLWLFGMYRSFRVRKTLEILSIIFKTAFLGFIIFGSFTYLFKIIHISRVFVILVFIIATGLLSIEKVALIAFFRFLRRKGFNFRRILIVGTNKRAQRFIGLIEQHAEWGLKIIGLVDEDTTKIGEDICGYKIMGAFKDIPEIVHKYIVDEVAFVVPRSWLNRIEEILHFCESEGLKIHLAVDYFELKFSKAKQADLAGFPLLTFESTSDKLWHLLIKRCFDIVFSGFSLLILSPLFAIISIIIKLTSKGPVFFQQERSGLNGRRFILYKFRTMVSDAETKLSELLNYNEMKGPVFKMANDPRLTKLGKFLRKLSVDELPQLVNVFNGDMSIVGPRPPIPAEVNLYDNWQRRRLSMRPGITCLWQVNGRNRITDFDEWTKLDLEYIDKWSLWLDFKILFKTIPAVLLGIGAK